MTTGRINQISIVFKYKVIEKIEFFQL